jgi:hypothetical protein
VSDGYNTEGGILRANRAMRRKRKRDTKKQLGKMRVEARRKQQKKEKRK